MAIASHVYLCHLGSYHRQVVLILVHELLHLADSLLLEVLKLSVRLKHTEHSNIYTCSATVSTPAAAPLQPYKTVYPTCGHITTSTSTSSSVSLHKPCSVLCEGLDIRTNATTFWKVLQAAAHYVLLSNSLNHSTMYQYKLRLCEQPRSAFDQPS